MCRVWDSDYVETSKGWVAGTPLDRSSSIPGESEPRRRQSALSTRTRRHDSRSRGMLGLPAKLKASVDRTTRSRGGSTGPSQAEEVLAPSSTAVSGAPGTGCAHLDRLRRAVDAITRSSTRKTRSGPVRVGWGAGRPRGRMMALTGRHSSVSCMTSGRYATLHGSRGPRTLEAGQVRGREELYGK
jgi:hypothetical protein